MKNSIITIIAVIGLLSLTVCKSNTPQETELDKQIGLLVKTWKLKSVTNGGNNVMTDGWVADSQFSITGSKGNASLSYGWTTGRAVPGPWAASGKLNISTSSPLSDITRDDNVAMKYTVTSSTLQITFTYTGAGFTSRQSNITGAWVFNFAI